MLLAMLLAGGSSCAMLASARLSCFLYNIDSGGVFLTLQRKTWPLTPLLWLMAYTTAYTTVLYRLGQKLIYAPIKV